jgi:enamine deaminase RidA (YjgF/YER057c/UK114 family)
MSDFKKIKSVSAPPPPGGSYVSVNVRNKVAYVAIQFPIGNGEFLYQGRLGDTLTTNDGYLAARLCALNIISHMEKAVGLEQTEGLNHLDIYYQKLLGWDEGPRIADGASDLFNEVMGDKGRHSRAIVGVESLPRNFCVGIVASFSIK